MSFVELFQHLEKYLEDPVHRFKEVLRVKRGIEDTSLLGGCYKDQVYLIGAIKILRNRKTINFTKLYCGKIAVEDILRPEIQTFCNSEDVKYPVFISNLPIYLSALDRIAQINGID